MSWIGAAVVGICIILAALLAWGVETFQDLPEETEHDEHEEL